MIELKSKPEPEIADGEQGVEEPRIELFSIDGQVYTIPDKAKPNISLQYLYISRTQGVGIAESWLAERMLGSDGYLALINFADLESEDYNQVVAAARAVAMGEYRPKDQKKDLGSGPRGRTAPVKRSTQRPKKQAGS